MHTVHVRTTTAEAGYGRSAVWYVTRCSRIAGWRMVGGRRPCYNLPAAACGQARHPLLQLVPVERVPCRSSSTGSSSEHGGLAHAAKRSVIVWLPWVVVFSWQAVGRRLCLTQQPAHDCTTRHIHVHAATAAAAQRCPARSPGRAYNTHIVWRWVGVSVAAEGTGIHGGGSQQCMLLACLPCWHAGTLAPLLAPPIHTHARRTPDAQMSCTGTAPGATV